MFSRSVHLYCAVLLLLSIWRNVLWSRRSETDEKRHSPQGSLSIINYGRCPNLWYVFEDLQFEASCCIWRNSWFWTEGWRRRPAMSRGHVCLMALVMVNQAPTRAAIYEGGRRETCRHQNRMNNSASVSEFWKGDDVHLSCICIARQNNLSAITIINIPWPSYAAERSWLQKSQTDVTALRFTYSELPI